MKLTQPNTCVSITTKLTKYNTNMSNILSKNSSHWYNYLIKSRTYIEKLSSCEQPFLNDRSYNEHLNWFTTNTIEPSLTLLWVVKNDPERERESFASLWKRCLFNYSVSWWSNITGIYSFDYLPYNGSKFEIIMLFLERWYHTQY